MVIVTGCVLCKMALLRTHINCLIPFVLKFNGNTWPHKCHNVQQYSRIQDLVEQAL